MPIMLHLDEILNFIERANDTEIRNIMDAVKDWYISAYPDWDVMYLALPKNDVEERSRLLQMAISSFSKEHA